MKFEIGMHTVIILVGPSQSGKSTWSNIFKDKVKQIDSSLRVSILSSDNIRHELLGEDFDRYDPRMLEASDAAFKLLENKLEALMSFPIKNEFIILDTTGLNPEWRKEISDKIKKHQYNSALVLFDYKTSDYFDGLDYHSKNIVAKHVDTFKKLTLPHIKRKSYNFSLTIKEKSMKTFNELEVDIINLKLWQRSHLRDLSYKDRSVAVIGDVHEHLVPLEQLIEKIPDNTLMVFVGDLVDKGEKTKETVEYFYNLLQKDHRVVVGNHEAFVARRLRGEIESISNEKENFSSLDVLMNDEDLRNKFLWIYDNALPFACIENHGKTVYVTHAPCQNKYIGKLDAYSQKFQRNFYFSSRTHDDMIKELSFLEDESKNTYPIHIFGHVAHCIKDIERKNKVWLDSGSVYGGKLSAYLIKEDGYTKVIQQKSFGLKEEKLIIIPKKMKKDELVEDIKIESETNLTNNQKLLVNKEQEVKNEIRKLSEKHNLNPDKKYWLHNFYESGAKFISGTMSPSKSNDDKLEPIETALDYFYNNGVEKVIIEPKFMGSRLQVYLHKNGKEDFAITRSGSKLGFKNEMKKVFEQLHDKFDKEDFWNEQLILDGELLPWSLIGKDLINKEFKQYAYSIEKELNLLNQDNIFKGFNIEESLDKKLNRIKTFIEQANWFGRDYDVEYKPFSILKADNELFVYENQEEIFKAISDEPYLVINTDRSNYEKANNFFNELTQQKYHEGVVIKPLYYKKGVAPYMKVRNENYLHLIYGYDYLTKYDEMRKGKKVNKKLELSISEYEIGLEMLKSENDVNLINLAFQLNYEIEKEKDLDIRL